METLALWSRSHSFSDPVEQGNNLFASFLQTRRHAPDFTTPVMHVLLWSLIAGMQLNVDPVLLLKAKRAIVEAVVLRNVNHEEFLHKRERPHPQEVDNAIDCRQQL